MATGLLETPGEQVGENRDTSESLKEKMMKAPREFVEFTWLLLTLKLNDSKLIS